MPESEVKTAVAAEEPLAPSPALSDDNPFASMMEKFDEAAAILGLAPDAYSVLRVPDREYKFSIPVTQQNGDVMVLDGYRIQHNLSLGPCLGGMRLDRDLRREELRALAAWMTWKCAVLNVPFGGSMGGIDYDPRRHDPSVTESVIRRYTAGVMDMIGPERDVTMPDLHVDEQIMAWMLDTYSMHVRHTENAVVVGKPRGLGGTIGADSAIGLGVRVVSEARLKEMGYEGPAHVVIQGAGTVGKQVARAMVAHGHKVIAMGDVRGGVFRREGLDVEAVLAHRRDKGTVCGFSEADAVSCEELLELECDVLIPAAGSNQITRHNAPRVRAHAIVEAANAPTTAKADAILSERGIPIVPDLLGNAGSVIIAYFEWVQNRAGYEWRDEVIHERLERQVLEAYESARKVAAKHKVGMRLATCMLGVKRVAYFDRIRGTYA